MAIKRKMTLATPMQSADGLQSVTAFTLDYIYVNDVKLTVYLKPTGAPPVDIFLAGALDVPGRGGIVLNAAQSLKVNNFLQAVEDACKSVLELP